MAASPPLLGRPGDLVPHDGLVDCYTTRIGGTPALPAGCQDMPDCRCSRCGAQLVLLLQVLVHKDSKMVSQVASTIVSNKILFLPADARPPHKRPGRDSSPRQVPIFAGLCGCKVPRQLEGPALPAKQQSSSPFQWQGFRRAPAQPSRAPSKRASKCCEQLGG
jgi:hypothetical protein